MASAITHGVLTFVALGYTRAKLEPFSKVWNFFSFSHKQKTNASFFVFQVVFFLHGTICAPVIRRRTGVSQTYYYIKLTNSSEIYCNRSGYHPRMGTISVEQKEQLLFLFLLLLKEFIWIRFWQSTNGAHVM